MSTALQLWGNQDVKTRCSAASLMSAAELAVCPVTCVTYVAAVLEGIQRHQKEGNGDDVGRCNKD